MSKEEEKPIEPSEPDVSWIHWFQRTKHENLKGLLIFISLLNDFVIKHPDDAKYLTVETMHAILMEEI